MMTVEDIIEELFGEIEDEYDNIILREENKSNSEFLLSGRHNVHYINEKFKLNLPEAEQYETLGGLIVYNTEEIPNREETLKIKKYKFTILEATNTKIDLVKLEIL